MHKMSFYGVSVGLCYRALFFFYIYPSGFLFMIMDLPGLMLPACALTSESYNHTNG